MPAALLLPLLIAVDPFDAALELEQRGHPGAAREAYRALLAQVPTHGRALINLGILETKLGQPKVGLELCAKARGIDARAAKAHYCEGLALAALGRDAEAQSAQTRAAALDPAAPAPEVELGHLARKTRRHDDAVAHYRAAVRLQADEPDLHVHLGYCYKELGLLDAALVEYQKAVQKDPSSYFGHLNRGWVLVRLKRDDEAEAAYLVAARLRPQAAAPHFNLGNLHRRTGALARAVEDYGRAAELEPRVLEHHFEHARALWAAGRTEEAQRALGRAESLGPTAEQRRALEKTRALLASPPPRSVSPDPTPEVRSEGAPEPGKRAPRP